MSRYLVNVDESMRLNIVSSYFKIKRIEGSTFIGEASLKHLRERQHEYLVSLANNARHAEVHKILLIVEGQEAYQHFREHVTFNKTLFPSEASSKIIPVLRLQPGQPTYAELFYQANQLLPGTLSMISNADVFLSPQHFSVEKVQELFEVFDKKNSYHSAKRLALALTRYESDNATDAPLIREYRGSHDAFILKPPVALEVLGGTTHPQNCYQAENIVIYELKKAQYTVLNPCLDLRLVHQHAADLRQWRPSVDATRYGRSQPIDCTTAMEIIRNGG